MHRFLLILAAIGLLAAGCTRPGDPLKRAGDEIVVAGQLFHTGTPVVLWTDPKGYDAYRARCHFEPDRILPRNPVDRDNPNRYNERGDLGEELSARVEEEGWTLFNVQEKVDQFVIHYDVCGTSRQCFKVLQDLRGLSVQFMLDIDGTIYQTLDLKERAWHATSSNSRSVGVEIAQIGAYPDMKVLDEWYGRDENGWPYIILPSYLMPSGVRTPGFVGRPARKEVVRGLIHGKEYMQYDFTNEQYEALIRLTAALNRVLPKIRLDAPRDPQGNIVATTLEGEQLDGFQGVLGHYHIQRNKTDPGPAFDWDRVLTGARQYRQPVF